MKNILKMKMVSSRIINVVSAVILLALSLCPTKSLAQQNTIEYQSAPAVKVLSDLQRLDSPFIIGPLVSDIFVTGVFSGTDSAELSNSIWRALNINGISKIDGIARFRPTAQVVDLFNLDPSVLPAIFPTCTISSLLPQRRAVLITSVNPVAVVDAAAVIRKMDTPPNSYILRLVFVEDSSSFVSKNGFGGLSFEFGSGGSVSFNYNNSSLSVSSHSFSGSLNPSSSKSSGKIISDQQIQLIPGKSSAWFSGQQLQVLSSSSVADTGRETSTYSSKEIGTQLDFLLSVISEEKYRLDYKIALETVIGNQGDYQPILSRRSAVGAVDLILSSDLVPVILAKSNSSLQNKSWSLKKDNSKNDIIVLMQLISQIDPAPASAGASAAQRPGPAGGAALLD